MPQTRSTELRVGIFVLVCLVVTIGLIMRFSKQAQGVKNAYYITVTFPTVSGIVPDASVQYAGIPVGKVSEIRLREEGAMRVALTLAITEGVVIRKDATFAINTSGLLGDKYVDVQPGSVGAEPLQDGDQVEGRTSVDLSEAITRVRDVLQSAAGTIERVDKAIQRLDETVLSRATLEHFSSTIANLDQASTNTIELVTSLRDVVAEQRDEIGRIMQNFGAASSNLNASAGRVDLLVQRVDGVVSDNAPQIAQTFTNLSDSTDRLNAILAGLQRGEGTAGRLLVDPSLHDEVIKLVQNWRRYGLLYKEGTARRDAAGGGAKIKAARAAGEDSTEIQFGVDFTR